VGKQHSVTNQPSAALGDAEHRPDAARLRIPFVTGPAVCAPLTSPAGGRAVALATLPLTLREERVPRPQVA